jgi:plasmid maintenance system antidote protein VapI
MKRDVAWRTAALAECWEKKMTPQQFADYVGVTRALVYAIFAGREWKTIPRPKGFTYPFPYQPVQNRSDDAWKAECLEDYVRDHMTPQEFAEHCGFKLSNAYLVLQGKAWTNLPRPEGFAYPWPERANLGSRSSFRRRQGEYVEVLRAMREEGLSRRDVATRLQVADKTVDEIARLLVEKGLLP